MSSADDDWETPTPVEDLPLIVRDPSKRIATREEADRLLALVERRRLWPRFLYAFRALIRRLFRR